MIVYEDLKKSNFRFYEAFRSAFELVLGSGRFILGNQVNAFEEEFASYCDTEHCVGVASGLDAIVLSLRALEIGEPSEVLVASNTYIASILGILGASHIPVLVEPEIGSRNIDPGRLEDALTNRTKVVMPVHLYGRACDMNGINDVAKRHGLYVVEDAAQAHGAVYRGCPVGALGDVAAFSFYPTKNLGCLGDGGAVTTNDGAIADRVRALRNYGSIERYKNERVGCNSRLDELQAAFLRMKLPFLDEINAHKRALAAVYFEELQGIYGLPNESMDHDHVYHIFNVLDRERDQIREYLKMIGILTDIHYPTPPHRQSAMRGILSGDYPISEEIHGTTLSLPISPFHTVDDIGEVCAALRQWRDAHPL